MHLPPSTHLQKHFKFINPGANLIHHRKADATDLIFCDTPAIDRGETMAHIFVGVVSRLTDVFKSKTRSAETFLGPLQDQIWMRGAPTKLLMDNARIYQSWHITWYLHDIWTSLWQCETKHQHQNYAENCYKLVKRMTNQIMDWMNVPAYCWFLCIGWVYVILNHFVHPSIGDEKMTPLMMSTFNMTDISPLLVFTFWQPVYVLLDAKEQSFPGKSKEVCGHFVGICEHIGNDMMFKILLYESHENVCSSLV